MKFSAVMLVVRDLAASRRFYEQLLGQTVQLDLGANVSYRSGVALQTKESWLEFIGRRDDELAFGGKVCEVYFEEDDFDGFLKKLAQFGDVEPLHLPLTHDWGQQTVRLLDPDGHVVEVGESMETVVRRFVAQGLTVEEVCARSLMPPEFVRYCISPTEYRQPR